MFFDERRTKKFESLKFLKCFGELLNKKIILNLNTALGDL
jgi:hypothetical protein